MSDKPPILSPNPDVNRRIGYDNLDLGIAYRSDSIATILVILYNRLMVAVLISLIFTLTDVQTGRPVRLDQINSEVLVVVFTGARCPISRAYSGVLSEVQSHYEKRGVRILAINSNESENIDKIRRAVQQDGIKLMTLKDNGHALADELGAQYTPEVFVLDRQRTVRYRGPIGNTDAPTANPSKVNALHLEAALDALLSGKPIPKPTIKAFGCAIERSALLNPRKH